MAVDAMEVDLNTISPGPLESEKERKRKHKHKDKDSSSPSKKKRKHESADPDKKSKKKDKEKSKSKDKKKSRKSSSGGNKPNAAESFNASSSSPYSLTTATLYLPLSPISISPTHALASLLAEHLSPLLLTYYPPLQGIILAYSNASISSSPPSAPSASTANPADFNPQPLTLATTAGEYGVMYVYLTATFLVFRPQRGQTLEGWVNVQSEGFLGAVVLNLFSVGIERKRLPSDWKWIPPGEEDEYNNSNDTDNNENQKTTSTATSDEDDDSPTTTTLSFNPDKEHFKPVNLASDANPFADTEADAEAPAAPTDDHDHDAAAVDGYFQSVSGHRVRGTVTFRVVDIDVIPGTERDRGFMSIEGTMLSPEEEAQVLQDEQSGVLAPASGTTLAIRKSTLIPQSSISGTLVSSSDVEIVDTPSKKAKVGSSKLRP